MTIHHAPWSRWLKTMWFKGTVAYELQVGPLVFQWFHESPYPHHRRIHVWRDRYWRRGT